MTNKKEIIEKGGYGALISSIGTLLENARKSVYAEINQILVKTYWGIGKNLLKIRSSTTKKDY